jgi:hypothetical protein
LFQHFTASCVETRREFDERKNDPPLRPLEPKFGGAAFWAESVRRCVGRTWAALGRAASPPPKGWLAVPPVLAAFRDARDAFARLDDALLAFAAAKYAAWCAQLAAAFGDAAGAEARLDLKIMARYSAKDAKEKKGGGGGEEEEEEWGAPRDGELRCNFEPEALAVFTEVAYWEKFNGRFSTPAIVMSLRVQAEKLGHLRGKVTDVVSACEEYLFRPTHTSTHFGISNVRNFPTLRSLVPFAAPV